MNRIKRVAIGTLAVIGALFLVLQWTLVFTVKCQSQRMSSAVSPDGQRIAEHYLAWCKPDNVVKAELHLVKGKKRVSTVLGVATTNTIGLAWRDNDWLTVSVPTDMESVFDRKMDGVEVEFHIVPKDSLLNPDLPVAF